MEEKLAKDESLRLRQQLQAPQLDQSRRGTFGPQGSISAAQFD